MRFGMGCSGSKAGKEYQRRMLATMGTYIAVVLAATQIVRHGHPAGWHLYFWSLTPVVPILFMLMYMGIYLRDEKDEYVRMITVRSLLVATAALLGTMVASDFLRSFAGAGPLPSFVGFVLFFVSFGFAQGVQQMGNRGGSDD